jgi:hypothetical protein
MAVIPQSKAFPSKAPWLAQPTVLLIQEGASVI